MIAVLLVVALMCWLEKRLRRLLPESVELILNPLLTTLITASLAIVLLQPLGGYISDAITHGANLALDKGGLLVGALLSGLFLPLVLSGLHQGLVPIHVELVQAHGANPLLPILAMAGVGQVGATLAVLLKTRNARLKKVIKGALPVGILGIGEPLIFGVNAAAGQTVYRRLPWRRGRRRADQLLEGGDGDYLRPFRAAFGADHRLGQGDVVSGRDADYDCSRVYFHLDYGV
ncbi:PTS system EIIBC component SA0186 [Serratia rubidaea]|uniref:PTS system EIIBC component SA0186 n=1 Tax=Serratia rubidaea TaxID=61652 RepID=A0A4U9HPB6_SERRU|nr:PTS system EIIBC component SA0186 [Serratia rubidaea]